MPQSLQCPRCNGAVSVPDHAAGKRVKCPHCEASFLAPGVAATVNDDDDWLKLDDDPLPPSTPAPVPSTPAPAPSTTAPASASSAPAKPRKPTASPAPTASAAEPPAASRKPTPSSNKKPPAFTADEEALLAEFTNDLDDFTAGVEKPPPPHPSTAIVSPMDAAPQGPSSGAPVGSAPKSRASGTKPAKQADVVEYSKEYRVTCNICGSMVYAKASQAGQTLKCSDCYSPITVPPPPKIKKKPTVDLEEAGTFSFQPSETIQKRADPFQKSAEQLLEEASRIDQSNAVEAYDDTPSLSEWAKNVFGIFTDTGVVAHWIGLSVLGSIPAVIALSFGSPTLTLALIPAGIFLAVLTAICGCAILCTVANEQKTVSPWPTLDPLAWIGKIVIAVAAACVAGLPVFAACQVVLGTQFLTVPVTMLSIFAIFPFVLLSMLDMNTPVIPFSAEVARSVNKSQEAWGGFYFSSGLVFVAVFLIFGMARVMSPQTGAVVCIVTAVGGAFIYFSMLGRLAYAIGQSIETPQFSSEGESKDSV